MISLSNIDQIIPGFLRGSELFKLVVLDVDGNVLQGNDSFLSSYSISVGDHFGNFLSIKSELKFEEVLENSMLSPKENFNAVLELKLEQGQIESLVWEFSVLTDKEMDLMGMVGIGVNLDLMSESRQYSGFLDLLAQANLTLNREWKVIKGDKEKLAYMGLNIDDVLGQDFRDFLSPSARLADFFSENKYNRFDLDLKMGRFEVISIKEQDEMSICFIKRKGKPTTPDFLSKLQLESIPLPVWILDQDGILIQQNQKAKRFSPKINGQNTREGKKFEIGGEEFEQSFSLCLSNRFAKYSLSLSEEDQKTKTIHFSMASVEIENAGYTLILVQAHDSNEPEELMRLKLENKKLKEVALKPSYILRSPLSSMLGLLDLIDSDQLDPENKKYFSHLKPLANELDQVIRKNAKKLSSLD
ncbi:hypothetical protein [Algoriphagus sediminis]|uniref:PAS domain-containing protein n=1 Tax=Algoriphagus sediminis TaxID=3057113 RepID=A0ABT7YEP9_9BACT|nr:hypothetical protein [Algoriphagus sediminis]MDN3204810.1 hypothetical protein [Algoriphagus sediminis]